MIAHDQAEPDRIKHLAEAIQQAMETRRRIQTHCPAHDDNSPSLSIRGNARGGLSVNCFAACSVAEVKAAIKALGLWPKARRSTIVKRYPYQDESGTLLFEKVRYDPKDFRLRRPDGKGGWIYSIKGLPTVPYRLPQLAQATPNDWVLIVGGEKHCDNALSLGLFATTSPYGEGRNWPPEINHYFRGKRIVFIPDNDTAGELYAKIGAKNLLPEAQSVRIMPLPDLPPKGDLSDWIERGGVREQLLKLIEDTVPLCDTDLANLKADLALEANDYQSSKRKIEQRYSVILKERGIYDEITREVYSYYDFTHIIAPTFRYRDEDGKERPAAQRWIEDPKRREYRALKFMPGWGPEAEHCLNVWPGFAIEPRRIETPPPLPNGLIYLHRPGTLGVAWFFLLVRHVFNGFDGDEDVQRFIEWCAWPFAHPTKPKMFVAWIIWSRNRGIGKSLIVEILMALYGPELSATLSPDVLASKYDGAIENKQLINPDETTASDRHAEGNKMKAAITTISQVINPKYGKQKAITNYANWLITSNSPSPIRIDGKEERRYEVVESHAEPLSLEFVNEIVLPNLRSQEKLCELLWYFQNCVCLDGFDPHAPARRTEAFHRSAEAGRSDVETFAFEVFEGQIARLSHKDVWHLNDIINAAPVDMQRHGFRPSLRRTLLRMEPRSSLSVVKVESVPTRLWTIRNIPKWARAGGKEIADEYMRAAKVVKY